jgi:hypothetical protein
MTKELIVTGCTEIEKAARKGVMVRRLLIGDVLDQAILTTGVKESGTPRNDGKGAVLATERRAVP